MRRVVITGIGLVCPLGREKDVVWRRLLQGDHGISKLLDIKFETVTARIAGVVHDTAISHHPRFIQFALDAAQSAITNSKITLSEDMGVSIGAGMSCVEEISKEYQNFISKGPRRVSPHFVPRILGNMAAGHVCIAHGLRGPVYSQSTACATGASAIVDAFKAIKLGEADVMLAGATEACIDPLSIAGFCQAKALTTKYNDAPGEASRPFDRDRSGFVMGEGAAVLMMEELEHAKGRDASIHAELLGYGCSADAHHITASHPNGLGAQLAMRRALASAQIQPEQVDYINAHGTSTSIGDRAELEAISAIFPHVLSISSTKGATGHLLSAAGALEAAFTVLSLETVSALLISAELIVFRDTFRLLETLSS